MSIDTIVSNKYRIITRALIEKGLTITTMESCTSGMVASLLTDTEGSSAVVKGAFVTYCNEAKIMQGVPAKIIETYGVYSKETAVAMARAAASAYDADMAIGVTGTMGNVDPANNDSIPGEVFFAIYYKGSVSSRSFQMSPRKSRHEYKLYVADVIGDEIISILQIE